MAREAILTRQAAEFKRHGRIQQTVTRYIVAAVYAAAGSKRGAKKAEAIEFFVERVRRIASTESMVAQLGEPLVDWDDLVAGRVPDAR
jgi:hypothetical protein